MKSIYSANYEEYAKINWRFSMYYTELRLPSHYLSILITLPTHKPQRQPDEYKPKQLTDR